MTPPAPIAGTLATPLTAAPWPASSPTPPALGRCAARLLPLVVNMALVSGCLIPPDDPVAPPAPNTGPRFDLDSLDPAASLFDVDEACACFRVRAVLVDDEDDALRVRVATNVGRDNDRARCVSEERTGPAALGQSIEAIVIPSGEFLAGFPGESVHTISLYATDASDFLSPLSAAADCARVGEPDGGPAHFVTEQRWTVRFVPSLGDCHGCAPPSGG